MEYSESITLLERRIAQLEAYLLPAVLPQHVREELFVLPTEPARYQVRWIDTEIGFEVVATGDDANAARITNRRMWSEARERYSADLAQMGAPPGE